MELEGVAEREPDEERERETCRPRSETRQRARRRLSSAHEEVVVVMPADPRREE